MSASDVILGLVVVTAICFDFTNGFHDTANAVATSIATGALKPRVAVMMSAILNPVGRSSRSRSRPRSPRGSSIRTCSAARPG
jgi:phosphate/sulfate permease